MPLTVRYLSATVEDGGLSFSGAEIGMILGLAGSIGAVVSITELLQRDIRPNPKKRGH